MSGAEEVRLMTDAEWLILCGLFLTIIVISLIMIAYLDHQVSKLRKENRLLHRVLSDSIQLENSRIRAAQAMLREAGHASWLPPGW